MLSYMLPVDEKPPPVPPKGLQLALVNGRGGTSSANAAAATTNTGTTSTLMSKESSVSSFGSDATTATPTHSSMTPPSISEKSKPKVTVNGTKHQPLKRVSFGSSKGSMVETLIYESPLQEEPEPSPIAEHPTPFPDNHEQTEAEREKVRVSFHQQPKPQEVDLPDEPIIFSDQELMMAAVNATVTDSNHVAYNRTESTESGWDNPFRPDGDLSREADEIVQLIKGGKPITPTGPSPILDNADGNCTIITESPKKLSASNVGGAPPSANGNMKNDKGAMGTAPGSVDVQRGTTVPAGDASQVEHVVIKKKPKCKCCVIQ